MSNLEKLQCGPHELVLYCLRLIQFNDLHLAVTDFDLVHSRRDVHAVKHIFVDGGCDDEASRLRVIRGEICSTASDWQSKRCSNNNHRNMSTKGSATPQLYNQTP